MSPSFHAAARVPSACAGTPYYTSRQMHSLEVLALSFLFLLCLALFALRVPFSSPFAFTLLFADRFRREAMTSLTEAGCVQDAAAFLMKLACTSTWADLEDDLVDSSVAQARSIVLYNQFLGASAPPCSALAAFQAGRSSQFAVRRGGRERRMNISRREAMREKA